MHETAVALVEQLLLLSAQELAGAKRRGRGGGPVLWHDSQRGVVDWQSANFGCSARGCARRLVAKSACRPTSGGGVAIAASALACAIILVAGVSTWGYAQVLSQAAGTVGVSKSTVSRRFIEASAAQPAALNERSLADLAVR